MKFFSFWRSLASFRVRIALNLKGLAADVVFVDLDADAHRAQAYRSINPQMALPALVWDDGTTLFQSLAIIEYLDEVHPRPPLLPSDPRERARARGLAQIVACDSHPLVVPRVREYLEHELKIDEPARMAWCRHWHGAALTALEQHLSTQKETGRFCHGDNVTIADICLASQAAGAKFFGVEMKPFPTVARIAEECGKIDAFAKAHPLKQPGAPAS